MCTYVTKINKDVCGREWKVVHNKIGQSVIIYLMWYVPPTLELNLAAGGLTINMPNNISSHQLCNNFLERTHYTKRFQDGDIWFKSLPRNVLSYQASFSIDRESWNAFWDDVRCYSQPNITRKLVISTFFPTSFISMQHIMCSSKAS